MSTDAGAPVGAPELMRGSFAPTTRTLIDILRSSALHHPDATALDDGTNRLSYQDLVLEIESAAKSLNEHGIGRGDRVGIRIPSGTADLYVWILGVLMAGSAYVPVDFEDPAERASLVFGEAGVAAIVGEGGSLTVLLASAEPKTDSQIPDPADDAWIIFTSGSTGTPKGVAVTHRSAAAFVDAEARMFLQGNDIEPLGPEDRVLAGLSVAFDASCEEMWLAWRHGAALVPAPRSLVRTGIDLGPWLIAQEITVVSTVPTLAALWPVHSLDAVRLLIFGGEACPPELAERLVDPFREVWNTYGPTEATVVACGAELTGVAPIRIGLPLDGWDLAVVDGSGLPVPAGESGELIIGGVGLARYLDPVKDAEKFAPMSTLGWERAYRSGDMVRRERAGLVFLGRIDEQIKLGGRRIELGEIDAAMQSLAGVAGAAAAIRKTAAGNQVLVGYFVVDDTDPAGREFDTSQATQALRQLLPGTMVPMLARVDTLPTRTSGKVDRDALPWPLLQAMAEPAATDNLHDTAAWIAQQWRNILGAAVTGAGDDFFAHGGGSLTAAQLVSVLRAKFPEVTVADIYAHPKLGALAQVLDEMVPAEPESVRDVTPVPLRAQAIQIVITVLLSTLTGMRWLTWLLIGNNILSRFGEFSWAPTVSWWWVLLGVVIFISPPGRMAVTVAGARLLLPGLQPGTYPRGGSVHLRIWAAERLAEATGATSLAGAPWIAYYARGLGVKIGQDTDLHSLPPITGMLSLGKGCSVDSEVDLSGHWLDGDLLRVGRIKIGADAIVGSRSTLGPGATIGENAKLAAGSAVSGVVPDNEYWAGSPAVRLGKTRHNWPTQRPPRGGVWVLAYGFGAVLLAALPLIAAIPGLALLGFFLRDARSLGQAVTATLIAVPLVTVAALTIFILLTVVSVRLLSIGMVPGYHPVRGRVGWQVWSTEKLMDSARTIAFPLYASLLTPIWLRMLGAKVGSNVEASTVVMLPKLTTVGSGAFLADDTMVGSYELGGGWLRIEHSKVGKRAFLGNSGMTAPGRRIPKNGLIAVLSAAPHKSKAGSSWLGSPPVELRRKSSGGNDQRTYAPPLKLKVARALVETCRIIPAMVTVAIGLGILLSLEWLIDAGGVALAGVLSGVLLVLGGVLAGLVSVIAKWVLVGRFAVVEHPLWSSFVWRNELADTFVETVAAPWLAGPATGTPILNWWLRALGAKIGRGAWLETYWLPEADLVSIGMGATVNRGCVLQTHLFHDRIMSMDTVTLAAGATIGPHGVILPAAAIGENATVGPASLVMRGESVPANSRWIGNPIVSWPSAKKPVAAVRSLPSKP